MRQDSIAALLRNIQLEPWHVVRGCARQRAHHFGSYGAPIDVLPIRSGIVTSNRFAIEDQRGDRFAKLPDEPARGIEFTLVNLRTFGMESDDGRFARRCDRRWHLSECAR